jgi:amino acid transporter
MHESAADEQLEPQEPRLARGGVAFLGSLAQSIGLIGPSAGAGILVGAVFGITGHLGWVTWLIGTVSVCCVGYAIVLLARRFLTTGGLYPLAGKAGGRATGFFTAFGALFWLIIAAPAVVLASGIFIMNFLNLHAFGVHQSNRLVIVFAILTALLAAWIAYAGIKIAVEVLLAIELVTGGAIVLLLLYTILKHPSSVVDHAQFHAGNISFQTVLSGIVLVVFAFGGFESATVLGQETIAGRKNIPQAVLGSVLVAGLFLALTQYATVLGFDTAHQDLASSANPLGDLASIDGIGWYAYVINFCLILAVVSNNIALFNAGARMLYTLPREGVRGDWFLRISTKYHTPTSGVLTFLFVNLATMVGIAIWNLTPITAYGDLGTLSGYGVIVMYVVTCIATIIFLARLAPPHLAGIACSLIGGGIMSYGMYTFLHPFPKYPTSVFAWIFIASSAVSVAGYFVLRARGSTAFGGRSVDQDSTLDG